MSDEDKEYQQSVADMIDTGTIFLNPVFRIKAPRKRIGKKFAIQLEGTEAVWGIVCAFIAGMTSFSIFMLMGAEYPQNLIAQLIYSPIAWFVWAIAAFLFGRKLAHISPFMERSGEGASAWVRVSSRRALNRIASKIGLVPAYYNPVLSVMRDPEGNEVRASMAKEYIGIAPAPSAPFVKDPWIQEKLKDIPPEERNYELYPDACEQIDIRPTGFITHGTEHKISRQDIDIANKVRKSLEERKLDKEDLDEFWEN